MEATGGYTPLSSSAPDIQDGSSVRKTTFGGQSKKCLNPSNLNRRTWIDFVVMLVVGALATAAAFLLITQLTRQPPVHVYGYGTTFGNIFLQYAISRFVQGRPNTPVFYTNENLDDFVRLKNGSANFIGYDNPGSYVAEMESVGIYGFPILAAGIVPVINLGTGASGDSNVETPTDPFVLTTDELVRIFNRSMTSLCNSTKYNPTWNRYLCSQNLTLKTFHRTAASGTNYIFTRALSRFSPAWSKNYGYGLTNRWPPDSNVNNGSLIENNEAMLFSLALFVGSIGYVPYPTFTSSTHKGLIPVSIATESNGAVNIVTANNTYIQAVMNAINISNPSQWHYDLAEVDCPTCWPITGFSYLAYRANYPKNFGIFQRVAEISGLISFFEFLLSDDGLSMADYDGYVRPPAAILARARSRVLDIHFGGEAVPLEPFPYQVLAACLLGVVTLIACVIRIAVPLLRRPTKSRRRRRETRDDHDDRTKNSLLQQIYDEDPSVTSSRQPRFEDNLRRSFIDTNEIVIQQQIGKGAYGEVYLGTYIGAVVAIKRMLLPTSSERMEVVENFVKEAGLMAHIRHPNIVQFLGASVSPPYLYLITEYCAQGSLHDVLHGRNQRQLTPPQKRAMLIDAVLGIMYLHGKGIVHRDIKTQNLLVDRVGTIKVADFGTSAALGGGDLRATGSERSMKTMVGTPEYVAPEVVTPKGKGYSAKADIYSFGIVMWEVWSGVQPYHDKELIDIIFGVTNDGLRPPIDKIDDPVLAQLIQRCWDQEPESRPTFDEILATLRELDDEENM